MNGLLGKKLTSKVEASPNAHFSDELTNGSALANELVLQANIIALYASQVGKNNLTGIVNKNQCLPLPSVRMLTRLQAAAYVGISPSHFDKLVKLGKLPQPISMGTSKRWDINKLDVALSEIDVQSNDDQDPFELAFNSNH